MSDQPSRQTSGLAWAPDVPAHWTVKKLAFLASLQSGDSITADDIKDDGPYPVYGGNGLRGYTDRFTHDGEYVLIGRQGALCGNINYAKGEFWASEHAVVVAPREEIAVRWLGELLRAMELNQYSVSAAQPGLSVETIAALKVPIPALKEQRAIADYLDRETAQLDALVAAKVRALGLLAEKRRALLNRSVSRGLDPRASLRDSGIPWLGEIPAHWGLCHLKRVLASIDYGISESVEPIGTVAVLRMGDIQDGEVDYSKLGFVDAVDQALLLRPGDLVFNRTNSLDQIGKVALFRGKPDYSVSFASYLVRLRCGPRVLPEFLNWLLNSAFPIAWGRSEALPAIGQANLNPNRYGYLPIALPPLEEQRDIIISIDGSISKLDAVRAATERTLALLEERRAALIAAAVTGQIDVGSGQYYTDDAGSEELPVRRL